MNLSFSLGEFFTLGAFFLTFFEIRKASSIAMTQKYIDLRFQAYSDFFEAFSELPSTIKTSPQEHLKYLMFHYNRVIMITPKQYIEKITDYYNKYIDYYNASLSHNQTNDMLIKLTSARKQVIVILNSIILSYDTHSSKKKAFLKK